MKSLRWQLTLRLLMGGALLLLVSGTLLQWKMRRALTAEFDASLMANLRTVTIIVEQAKGYISVDFTGADVSQLQREDGKELFLLRAVDGREIFRSQSLGTAALPMHAGSIKAPTFFNITLTDGRDFRCVGVRVTPPYEDETPAPPQVDAVLTVGVNRATLDRRLAALSTSLLLVGAGALAALGAIVFWGVRAGLAPLERLGTEVAAVDAGSLATRFPIESLPDELRPIVVRLNELLARLESAFARERRFTATAAHELRTPLAELRALAEVNLSTPGSMTENTQSWRDALDTTLRMESLAMRLLNLARAEDSGFILQRTNVSLTQAFSDAWQPLTDRAAERGLDPQVALTPGLTAHTDPALLAVVLGNLCRNAVEHAPAGTSIHVRGNRLTDGVQLLFQNQAADLAEADVPHLFERFWRKDDVRSNGQHHGLGLALAAEFVALLGGTLSAKLAPNKNLEFTLWLPA